MIRLYCRFYKRHRNPNLSVVYIKVSGEIKGKHPEPVYQLTGDRQRKSPYFDVNSVIAKSPDLHRSESLRALQLTGTNKMPVNFCVSIFYGLIDFLCGYR